MDIEIVKKLIKENKARAIEFAAKYEKAVNYYKNKPDFVLETKKLKDGYHKSKGEVVNPLRNADNRIGINYHGLLVNQKASYMFTSPPLFDVGNKEINKKIAKILGDKFSKVCKDLCVNASNGGIAWLHLWKDDTEEIKYACVNPAQIIAVFDKGIESELLGVFRYYNDITDNGRHVIRYEYWNDKICSFYEVESGADIDNGLYEVIIDKELNTNEFEHGMNGVPFIPFFNDNIKSSDLDKVKGLIDTYVKIFNGFINDLEDIQEVIFILSNYGGEENIAEFLANLKKYKTIQIDSGEDGGGGLSTLNIDIPIDARKELLGTTRKLIFEQGMGIDPDPTNFGNSSGVALKFLYSLLEIKAGLMETEFKLSFGTFIRMICDVMNIPIKDDTIIQTWTRTSVSNDMEIADICTKSKGIVSDETLIAKHPFVENPEKELELISKQEEKNKQAELEMFGFDKDKSEDVDKDINNSDDKADSNKNKQYKHL